MELIIALATDDGNKLTNGHFGDALYFDIYRLNSQEYTFLYRISNSTKEENEHNHSHGEDKKASSIGSLLKKHQVKILVGKVFGPNLKKMKKQFVAVFSSDSDIKKTLTKLTENYEKIVEEWEKGENRNFLKL